MALDLAEIRDVAKDILYGSGLGEKPTLVLTSNTPAVSLDGKSISFTLSTGSGEHLRAGDILSVYGPASNAEAFVFYVISVSGDTVTCVNGYDGSSNATASDLSATFLEVMPLVTDHKIFSAIDAVLGRFLWPEVFDIATGTVTPDISSGQVALDSRDEEILHAWQKVGSSVYPISFHLEKGMDPTLFPSTVMGSFDFVDASTLYYAAKRRITTSSDSSAALVSLIGTGAAALSLGSTRVETTLDSSKKDSLGRGERDVSGEIWRDFLTQKQVYSEDLSRDTVTHFVIER